jgi:hypothetical protein
MSSSDSITDNHLKFAFLITTKDPSTGSIVQLQEIPNFINLIAEYKKYTRQTDGTV